MNDHPYDERIWRQDSYLLRNSNLFYDVYPDQPPIHKSIVLYHVILFLEMGSVNDLINRNQQQTGENPPTVENPQISLRKLARYFGNSEIFYRQDISW